VLDEMLKSFRPWLAEKISKREYLSWFAIAEDRLGRCRRRLVADELAAGSIYF
jgi:hypothetical protein